MLHKMSELRGWSHDEMMAMSKELFFRYYGYWYMEQFNEMLAREYDEKKNDLNRQSQENRQNLGL